MFHKKILKYSKHFSTWIIELSFGFFLSETLKNRFLFRWNVLFFWNFSSFFTRFFNGRKNSRLDEILKFKWIFWERKNRFLIWWKWWSICFDVVWEFAKNVVYVRIFLIILFRILQKFYYKIFRKILNAKMLKNSIKNYAKS
jgi:hypothetical protein